MADILLRPEDDILAEWTETPTGTAWSTIDEGENPATPDTDDFVQTTGQNNVSRHNLTTVTIESVQAAVIWAYVANNGLTNNWFASLQKADGTGLATITVGPGQAAGWLQASVSQVNAEALTQADVDGLRINLASGTNDVSPQTRTCSAVYVKLTYTAASVGLAGLGGGAVNLLGAGC